MDSVIKLQSDQGFSETWVPAEFVTDRAQNKLIDFVIPANTGTYDLGSSYVILDIETISVQPLVAALPGVLSTDTALFNNGLSLSEQTDTSTQELADVASMVRNCDMFSSERGMVESVRRLDSLRQLLWNIENDKAAQHDGIDMIGNAFGRRGPKNKTSSLIQVMGNNTTPTGTAQPSIKASKLTREYRINLSDMFGVGSAMWNSDVYGDTRIHMEIEPNRLTIKQMGGFEDVTKFDPAGVDLFFGQMVEYSVSSAIGTVAVGAKIGTELPLVTSIAYDNYQLDMPFYVGQSVNVGYTVDGTPVAGGKNVIISSIEYNLGTNGNAQPQGTKQVRIFTRTDIHTNDTAGVQTVTALLVKANLSTAATDKIRINKAEIVLTQTPSKTGPSSIDYRTYSTEEIQGLGLVNLTQQLIVEPNAQNLLVAVTDAVGTAPIQLWKSYRMSINNDDVCGNRDVVYNSPLHRDRIKRTMDNRGQDINNFSLQSINVDAGQLANANQTNMSPIYETLPLTQTSKVVNFNLVRDNAFAGTAGNIIFYKELVKTI